MLVREALGAMLSGELFKPKLSRDALGSNVGKRCTGCKLNCYPYREKENIVRSY